MSSRLLTTPLLAGLALFLTSCDGNLISYVTNPGGLGILSFIVLVLDIIAIIEISGSSRALSNKFLWILFIVFFPIGGLLIYYFFVR